MCFLAPKLVCHFILFNLMLMFHVIIPSFYKFFLSNFPFVDGDIDNNLCIACPPNSGIVHPPAGGFIYGVSKDQKIFKVPFY